MSMHSEAESSPKKPQTMREFWQEQRENGLTDAKMEELRNSLPPLETVKSVRSQRIKSPKPSQETTEHSN